MRLMGLKFNDQQYYVGRTVYGGWTISDNPDTNAPGAFVLIIDLHITGLSKAIEKFNQEKNARTRNEEGVHILGEQVQYATMVAPTPAPVKKKGFYRCLRWKRSSVV